MPLNKLDNFIKNTEGRILYVNPSDLDATDSIDNQGNSLARPFKTIQRAIIEAARFSYVRGNNNDIIEKTTILLFPGEHVVDNRPGWAIYDNGGVAYAVPRTGGVGSPAISTLSLTLDSNFDLTQEDNILYKFNSYYGGVIVPRGISLVGLDLRKTKIRPKYVPNPTDSDVAKSAVFRLTGTCYFWQFSFFDGNENETVYTNPTFFSPQYKSLPLFSHHKLTCFEYADGVNDIESYGLTDLDMYYSKLSNAFNVYREIVDKFPENPNGFSKTNPEWEIVGAFATDPINISDIISGNGSTASSRITVTTSIPHKLGVGTPIKIRGVATANYNISTKVQEVVNDTQFTYLLPSFPINLNANPSVSGATVIVETDTVTGASPYVFNCSLRSVWGMNGMFADGSKASGFKSMIVAQFTGVSLQKDDRAFVKYDKVSRTYNGVSISPVYGAELPLGASQTDSTRIYHLDSEAIYRSGWESSHIKISNDAFIQVVSVFAIGFNKHFDAETGGDFSITNSNSNFGQIALNSSGFRKESFEKDDKAYITSIIPPRALSSTVEENIDWLPIDVGLTTSVGISSHLYLFGYNSETSTAPSSLAQGFKIGAKNNDLLYVNLDGTEYSARILMDDFVSSSSKTYSVTGSPSSNIFTIGNHTIQTGEKVIIISEVGDLPENINPNNVYYAIRESNGTQIKLASSLRNAQIGDAITVYGGQELKIISRVSDKESGEIGSPLQFDSVNENWFIRVESGNSIYNGLNSSGGVAVLNQSTDLAYVKRISDDRSLDEKIYKLRIVIPKEATNSKNPESGFIIQESSSTGARVDADFTAIAISASDFDYNRNPRFISTCTVASNTVTVIAEKPHNLQTGEIIIIKNVQSTTNTIGLDNLGYNGTFTVASVPNDMTFTYSIVDINGISHSVGNCINNTSSRTLGSIGRFERNNNKSNIYIYRNEIISDYIEGVQDGIYHAYPLNASNSIPVEFTNIEYSQSPVDLYPQLDRDNFEDNPPAAKTFAKRAPIGDIVTSDLKKSITRETVDKFIRTTGSGLKITTVSSSTSSAAITFDRGHGFSGIVSGTITGGSGYINGTYYNVRLFNDVFQTEWKGATATVTVSGGAVTSATITSAGSGYSNGNALYFDLTRIGTGNGLARLTLSTAGISTNIGDVVQFTGVGTTSDTYHRITSVNSTTQISIAKTSGDPVITNSQYAFLVGPSVQITSTSYNSSTGLLTVNCTSSHGLLGGNKFRIIDSSNNNLGDYIVQGVGSVSQFTALTRKSISAANGYILKHGLSANDAVSDATEENFGVRNVPFYSGEVLRLNSSILGITSALSISTPVGISTSQRFQLGTYIQIDNEILRIISSSNDSNINVIRGVLGTRPESHSSNSVIKKIKPIAVEFRRPSILRASGHTFEYLGYGPGNYSTALPQIQVKTLSDRESFLVQSQERSCGIVVYNGINNSGDVFAGNTKTLASSGEIVSYDIPNPTVTGQSSSALNEVFDEVTIKKKLLVEGGTSGTLLSQFDGPVTFNREVRIKGNLTLGEDSIFKITNPNIPASISSDLLVGEGLTVGGNASIAGNSTLSGEVTVNTGIIPDTDEGAYLGSSTRPFSQAWVGEIGIATGTTDAEDRTIRSVTGDLTLSATTGNVVAISTNASVTGDLNVTGKISAAFLDVPNVSPIGSIVMWPSADAPPINWRICNGAQLSQTTYSDLFALIGTTYNTGGETVGNFRLPDLRNRFVVGTGPSYALNGTGGAATVALQEAQLPSHTHTYTMNSDGVHDHNGFANQGGGHDHTIEAAGDHSHGGATNGGGGHSHGGDTIQGGGHSHGMPVSGGHSHTYESFGANSYEPGGNNAADRPSSTANVGGNGSHNHPIDNAPQHAHQISAEANHQHPITAAPQHSHNAVAAPQHQHPITSDGSHVHGLTINSTGSGGAHENLPPYRSLYYIIRIS